MITPVNFATIGQSIQPKARKQNNNIKFGKDEKTSMQDLSRRMDALEGIVNEQKMYCNLQQAEGDGVAQLRKDFNAFKLAQIKANILNWVLIGMIMHATLSDGCTGKQNTQDDKPQAVETDTLENQIELPQLSAQTEATTPAQTEGKGLDISKE